MLTASINANIIRRWFSCTLTQVFRSTTRPVLCTHGSSMEKPGTIAKNQTNITFQRFPGEADKKSTLGWIYYESCFCLICWDGFIFPQIVFDYWTSWDITTCRIDLHQASSHYHSLETSGVSSLLFLVTSRHLKYTTTSRQRALESCEYRIVPAARTSRPQ